MGGNWHTKNSRTSKRGAFLNGVWHCDCEPRLPADKFQTKNGGKNHGRWFYTCQNPQPKRCGFFLWADDAKVREEGAVLNNSRTEPNLPPQPQTPRKTTSITQVPTPDTRPRPTPPTIRSAPCTQPEREDSFEWSSSDEAAFQAVAEQDISSTSPETPRKSARTETFTSPGKRSYAQSLYPDLATSPTTPLLSSDNDDVFATPSTSTKSHSRSRSGLLSPQPTPSSHHTAAHPPASQSARAPTPEPSSLAASALEILQPLGPLPKSIEEQLVELLNRHDLRTQGIIKGRDITRLAVEKKEKKVAELQARIVGLEGEREMLRSVVGLLKQDIAVSKEKGSRRKKVEEVAESDGV